MMRSCLWYVLAGLLMLVTQGVYQAAYSQDFPYQVPQAPEFDRQGNTAELSQQDPPPSTWNRTAPRPLTSPPQSVEPRSETGQPKPRVQRTLPRASYAPTAPEPRSLPVPHPRVQGPPKPSSPQQANVQPQGPPDCSQFPMLIAQARSEEDMRFQARMYLTCLIHSGLPEDQARKHVISTIEMSRLAR
ncbi:MAG: hypothetical protein HY914_08415 [Desulfomonile tiedjei]|nr:hypothetical protein [Desulfomonile tiedjei]